MLLTETYKKRLALAESVTKQNLGSDACLKESVKFAIAQVLKNQRDYADSKKINEAFGNSTGTQMTDVGNFKRFALDLTTIAIPNTIATELVITHAMPTKVGGIQYWQIVAGSKKGGINKGDVCDVFADVFHLGGIGEDRMNYTGAPVAESVTLNGEGKANLAWTPISADFAPVLVGAPSGATIKVLNAETGEIKVTGASGTVKVKYVYDQFTVPQNDLPTLNAHVEFMPLVAKPRRIAVYFSQMAAFQAKQEQGLDLGDMLKTQAVAELSYEIDTEVVKMLYDGASLDETVEFNKALPYGIDKFQHYEAFAETVQEANEIIYNRTHKYEANYMVCNRSVVNLLAILRGWKDSGAKKAGPYFAGTIFGLKVFVHPIIPNGEFVMGFNGDDMMTSAGVFAPYMAIVPTAELQYADGGTSQGWSTLYDCRLLNSALLVRGKITNDASAYVVNTKETA